MVPGMVPPSMPSCRVRRVSGPPTAPTPAGLVGSASRVQEVANPGLRRHKAVAEAQKQASLRSEVDELTKKVHALEKKLSAAPAEEAPAAAKAAEPTIAELLTSLAALTAAATGDYGVPSSAVIGSGLAARPSTAPYRSLNKETASVASWSADAFGKSKTPGWYHLHRKQLLSQRAARAAGQPTGCYVSHSKYADEAVRIAATGRLAFSAGK